MTPVQIRTLKAMLFDHVPLEEIVETLRLPLAVVALEIERVRTAADLRRIDAPEQVNIAQRYFVKFGKKIRVERTVWEMFMALAKHGNRWIHRERVYWSVWGDSAEGGPEPKIMDITLNKLRAACPFTIESTHSGFILHGYALPHDPLPAPPAVEGITKERLMARR